MMKFSYEKSEIIKMNKKIKTQLFAIFRKLILTIKIQKG